MLTPFDLRTKLKWEGLPFREAASGRDQPIRPPTERGQALFEKYRLASWAEKVSRETLDECLGVLDLLDRIPPEIVFSATVRGRKPARVLDVGSKNWRYLGALDAWLGGNEVEANVEGVEIDAYRIYSNLRTRISCARHFSAMFSGPERSYTYRAGDVAELIRPLELATWFFPFVSPAPHRAWGLPRRVFNPSSVFQHVERLIIPGGKLVMCNQGDWEWAEAQKLFFRDRLRLRLILQDVVEGSLHPSDQPIFLTVWTRED
jgi:hypothetical protein